MSNRLTKAIAFRLSSTSRAELRLIQRSLDLSTDTSALQFAIRRTFNELPQLVPLTVGDANSLCEALREQVAGVERDEQLAAAYAATVYEVYDGPRVLDLEIGKTCSDLDALFPDGGNDGWAYITGENPGSRRVSPAENAERTRALDGELDTLDLPVYRGRGVGEDPCWAPEDSRLILGIDLDGARRVATLFGQNAFVHGVRGGAAELCILKRRGKP